MTAAKRTFRRIQGPRIESEMKKVRQERFRKIANFLGKTTNLVVLLAASVLIAFIWQQRIATPYLTYPKAVGGDYFNALTYAKFFAENLPFPPTGWMPFWNGGIPVVGGYFTTFFYLMYPLTHVFDVASSMELTSMILLLFFLLGSHFLFWEASRNHLLALAFTLILAATPAVYYSLMAEGLVIGSAMQWYLPLTLFFLTRAIKFQQTHLLLASAAVTGIAINAHAPMAVLTIVLPACLFILIAASGDPKDAQHTRQLKLWKLTYWGKIRAKLSLLTTFLLTAAVIGGIGLYSLIIQSVFSTGSQPCDSTQCWGEYPTHLNWFSPFLLPSLVFTFPAALIAWRIHKGRFADLLAPLMTLVPVVGYIAAARMHLIDPIASAFFPRRIFWAATLLTLFFAASSYRYIRKSSGKLSALVSAIFVAAVAIMLPLNPQVSSFTPVARSVGPQSLPMGIDRFIVPKYIESPQSEIIPEWIQTDETNYRIDSIRPDFFIWWNAAADRPMTRGYSNIPTQEHLDWLYYLQVSTLAPGIEEELEAEARLNRALFLLDNFGVDLLLESGPDLYDKGLILEKNVVQRSQKIRDWMYYQLNDEITGPIVSPTNAKRILVVSDPSGYQALLRAISLTNLNSKIIIPIEGPDSIDRLTQSMLDMTDAVILYQFKGSNWGKLERFAQAGGKLFIDIGSLENLPDAVPEILGMKSLELHDRESQWELTAKPSPLLKGIQTRDFAPLLFQGKPWKIAAPPSENFVEDWMSAVLLQNGIPILAEGRFGSGTVIYSGFNLPYHITSYQNYEEAKLLRNILSELALKPEEIGEFSVHRLQPTSITISSSGASGIYFKENYHSGWKAEVNGKPGSVYKSGLGFMYIPIPRERASEGNHITLEFRGSPVTWGLPLVGTIVFVLVLLYNLTPAPFETLKTLATKKIARPVRNWWARD